MLSFQDLILRLHEFWGREGCLLAQPYDVEKGAGTMNPLTFFRALGPEPWRIAYVEPSRRPADARYGENPNRLYQHHQYQVVIKPSPDDIVDRYLESLRAIGIDPDVHDIRLVEDNWEAPTLGAWGLGWEVWCDGMEITQFTYFQQVGGLEARPVSVEITYGLERLASYIQGTDDVFSVRWVDDVTYGDVFKRAEWEHSTYGFEAADPEVLFARFRDFEAEAGRLIEQGLVLPGYDSVLKCSHTFNLLEARRAISVTERTGYIGRVRDLARKAAQAWLAQREAMGFPLMSRWSGLAAAAAEAPRGTVESASAHRSGAAREGC